MGKVMKRSSFAVTPATTCSSNSDYHHHKPAPSRWQWPACAHLETLSFRATREDAVTFNPLPLSPNAGTYTVGIANGTQISCSANSVLESGGSISSRLAESGPDEAEMVIRGVRSDRLFFEPRVSNSLAEECSKVSVGSNSSSCSLDLVPYKECVFVTMESRDPFSDFRRSMEEMIVAHGMQDWDSLEELLGWYLKVNVKNNHGIIGICIGENRDDRNGYDDLKLFVVLLLHVHLFSLFSFVTALFIDHPLFVLFRSGGMRRRLI